MLTNQTIMKKVEKIFNKKTQSKPNVVHQSTIINATKSTPIVNSSVENLTLNRKNTNLKSIKRSKVFNELKNAENGEYDDYEASFHKR